VYFATFEAHQARFLWTPLLFFPLYYYFFGGVVPAIFVWLVSSL
jgi:hypothetical protein